LTEFNFNDQIVFDFYQNYHITWGPNHIERMIYKIYSDIDSCSLAFLNFEVHFTEFSNQYVVQLTENHFDELFAQVRRKTSSVHFIQMNLENMKWDYRYASSFVWNHSYFLQDTVGGEHYELHVPIPDGMQFHYSGFSGEPKYDFEAAQDIILNTADSAIQANLTTCGAYGVGLNHTSIRDEWREVAESIAPLAEFNFTRYESSLVELCAFLLQDYLKDIGIKLNILDAISWDKWVTEYLENPENNTKLCYSFGSWDPYFNDPIGMIEPLYGSNASRNCYGLSNATWNQMLLDSYLLSEVTSPTRQEIFHEIQEHFVKYQSPTFYISQISRLIVFSRYAIRDIPDFRDSDNLLGHWYWFNDEISYSYWHTEPLWDLNPWILFSMVAILSIITTVVIIMASVHINKQNRMIKEKIERGKI
ncbi:MAG: hypothetical protein EU530_09205, partial [Promethearchaeota archaeon]